MMMPDGTSSTSSGRASLGEVAPGDGSGWIGRIGSTGRSGSAWFRAASVSSRRIRIASAIARLWAAIRSNNVAFECPEASCGAMKSGGANSTGGREQATTEDAEVRPRIASTTARLWAATRVDRSEEEVGVDSVPREDDRGRPPSPTAAAVEAVSAGGVADERRARRHKINAARDDKVPKATHADAALEPPRAAEESEPVGEDSGGGATDDRGSAGSTEVIARCATLGSGGGGDERAATGGGSETNPLDRAVATQSSHIRARKPSSRKSRPVTSRSAAPSTIRSSSAERSPNIARTPSWILLKSKRPGRHDPIPVRANR